MRILVAVALAALAAWQLNSILPRVFGDLGFRLLVPVAEEAAKTTAALIVGAGLFPVHVSFGLVEAIYEGCLRPSTGVVAGAFAVIAHGIFGGIAALAYRSTGSWLVAIILPSLAHVAWNRIATRIAGGA